MREAISSRVGWEEGLGPADVDLIDRASEGWSSMPFVAGESVWFSG